MKDKYNYEEKVFFFVRTSLFNSCNLFFEKQNLFSIMKLLNKK
jgi:hypothetical protein